MNTFLRETVGALYSAILGAVVGFLSWLFLYLVYIGIHLFWDGFILEQNSKILIIGVCLFGGVLIGLGEKYIGHYPKTFHHVLAEYKKTGRVEYKSLPKAIVKIFTALWFGATVGPEAGLSGITGGLITYVGELLKFGFKRKDHEKINTKSNIEKIFEVPLYGFYNFVDTTKNKIAKKYIYTVSIIGGILIFLLMNFIDDKTSFITRFNKSIIGEKELIFLIPLFIIGIFIIFYSYILDKFIEKIFKPLQKYKMLNAIIGGIILGGLAITLPYILFSGEHTLKDLLISSKTFGIYLLLAIGCFKFISSKVCIATGWVGGPIFPIMFSSAAIGIAFAHIFSINLPFAVAIVISTALSGIMKNFKITVVLLILFFSFNTWFFILASAYFAELFVKKIPLFKTEEGL